LTGVADSISVKLRYCIARGPLTASCPNGGLRKVGMEAATIYYEPWDPSCQEHLFETYAQLLEHAPVYRAPQSGIWVVSSYDAVSFIYSRPDLFSNRPNQDETIGFPPKIDPDSPDSEQMIGRLLAAAVDIPLDFQELFTARVIVGADPPVHTRQRKLVSRGFTARRIAELRPMIEKMVGDKVRALEGRRSFDLVEEIAGPVPTEVISNLLSVEPEHYGDIRRWSDMLSSLTMTADRGSEDNMVALIGMLREFAQYFVPKIEGRRAHPHDDMLSDLVSADGADLMSATELVLFILVLLSAGNETTTNVIGNTVLQLLDRPDQLALLQADPVLLGPAIEESIRLHSPFQFLLREPVNDVEMNGVTIPAGDMMAIMVGAANRDPRVFENPNDFDPTRRTPHLAFGKGIHFCLGAPLARLEAEVTLRGLLPILDTFSVEKNGLRRHPSLLIHGYTSIPITVSC
jgi:cytochrome P450